MKISASAEMVKGASWEFNTIDGNEYTISFEKFTDEPNFIPLSNGKYYVSIIEGDKLSENSMTLTNAIKEIKTVKK